MKIRDLLDESKLRKGAQAVIPGMRKHDGLDNSSPYAPWRFSVAMAGAPDYMMDQEGPTGQKLVTMAYSKADSDIIAATEKHFGAKGTEVTPTGSQETDTTGTQSPVADWMKPEKKKKKTK
jgi:hypothetical protein